MRLLKCWGGLDCTYTKKTKHLWENRPKSSAKPRTNKYGIYLHGCVSCAQIRPQPLLFLLLTELKVLPATALPFSVILHHCDPGHVLHAEDLPLSLSLGVRPTLVLKEARIRKPAHRRGCHSKKYAFKNTSLEWKNKNWIGGENNIQFWRREPHWAPESAGYEQQQLLQ